MALETLTGSCLCGEVSYSLTTTLQHFYYCHCIQCRKTTGSAFAANILAEPTEIHWLHGEEQVKRFDYRGRGFTQVFCTHCGSGLPFVDRPGEILFVPVGSLDSVPQITPEANIFWGERAPWHDEGIAAPTHEGFDPL